MKKGSITIWLCLVLGALLSLFCAALFSARHAAGRAVLASAAEQGMYSLFSRFDRTLFDEYGILALDGGYSGSELKLGALRQEAEETVEFLTGSSDSLAGPDNLTGLSPETGEVTGYILLTDSGGACLKEQVSRALTGRKTAAAVQKVRNQISGYSSDWNSLEKKKTSEAANETEGEYRNLQESAAEGSEGETTMFQRVLSEITSESTAGVIPESVPETLQTENQETGILLDTDSESGSTGGGLVESSPENPIEVILAMRKLGILNLALPKGTAVSAGAMDQDRVSTRTLQTGMGIVPANETDPVDKVVLLEYLMDTFDDFTEAGDEETAGLKYQVEYAIGGKESDSENLEAVLNRLLAVREASNYLFLSTDPVKQEEIHAAAVTVSSLLGLTAAEPIVAKMLCFCWAFGESILDLRELLEGGKIPLVKTAASWQLSLNMLTHIQEEHTEQHSSENGLSYQWYLRMLLAAEKEETLTYSLMDLMEQGIRQTEGKEHFRLDNCLVSMTVQFRARQEKLFLLQAERSYNYS